MRRLKRVAATAGMTAALILQTGISVSGVDPSVTGKITTTFKTIYGKPEEIPGPEITANGTGCSLGDAQFRTEYDDWKLGKKVRMEITVNADSGKIFPTFLDRSQCKMTGTDLVSVKVLDDTTLQTKVDYESVTVLGTTEKVGWSSNPRKKAAWKSVGYVPDYTLTLYGDNKVVKHLAMESSNVDLSNYMKDMDRTYYYEVKAVSITSEQKKYPKEGAYVTSMDQELDWEDYEKEEKRSSGSGSGGSIKGNSYIMLDGSRTSNTWRIVSGKWHYFDGNSSRIKG